MAADHKPALARAPTLLRPMAAENAAEKVNGHVNVTRSLVQVRTTIIIIHLGLHWIAIAGLIGS